MDALERMHLSVREFVAGDMHISDNDLLSALLYKTFAQSEAAATDGSGSIAKMALSILKPLASYVFGVREMVVSLACDTRPRLGIMDLNYMGNATITTFTKYRSAELATPTTAESLAGVAMQVRQLVNSVDGAYIGSLMDAVDSNPSLNTQIIGCTSMYPTLVLSNHSRLSMYNADFGDGVQQWTSFVPGLKSGVGFIQSCPPCKDGVNVFVEAPVKIMKSMLMNEYWMDVAELVY
ncbi:hypothetical protein GGI12_003657 [Dipsacomyces acuminosporus]|nr:hypothetical protein GGI12_003657 [Dipsacomyces acuminosporus]